MSQCFALDVIEHNETSRDLAVLAELVDLYGRNEPIPKDDEYPLLFPRAPTETTEGDVFAQRHRNSVDPQRVLRIRDAIANRDRGSDLLRYICPWSRSSVPPQTADLILSQAVLQDLSHEHDRDTLAETVRSMALWLRPGGIMSHQVDLSAPIGQRWNDHWTMSTWSWRLVRGRRPYYFNRAPLSTYVELLESNGLDVVSVTRVVDEGGRSRDELAHRFKDVTPEDLSTRGVNLIARKRP
ncbi:MAG: hypothetical protein ABI640_05035 [Gammaproteobacteria bacterium]